MAHFLGLNNFLDTADDHDLYASGRVATNTTALGLAGTLTFRHAAGTTPVAYAVGDSLTTIAASINAALAAQNITATIVSEGSGYRLTLTDSDGDNFFVTDSGALVSQYNLQPRQVGTAGRVKLTQALTTNPSLLARGELSAAAGLAVGTIALTLGNATIANKIAALFNASVSIAGAGKLPAVTTRIADYAGTILSHNSAMASTSTDGLAIGESYRQALVNQSASVSQVNLDEEMANIIVLQNAYAAAARVSTTAAEMLETLIASVR